MSVRCFHLSFPHIYTLFILSNDSDKQISVVTVNVDNIAVNSSYCHTITFDIVFDQSVAMNLVVYTMVRMLVFYDD